MAWIKCQPESTKRERKKERIMYSTVASSSVCASICTKKLCIFSTNFIFVLTILKPKLDTLTHNWVPNNVHFSPWWCKFSKQIALVRLSQEQKNKYERYDGFQCTKQLSVPECLSDTNRCGIFVLSSITSSMRRKHVLRSSYTMRAKLSVKCYKWRFTILMIMPMKITAMVNNYPNADLLWIAT